MSHSVILESAANSRAQRTIMHDPRLLLHILCSFHFVRGQLGTTGIKQGNTHTHLSKKKGTCTHGCASPSHRRFFCVCVRFTLNCRIHTCWKRELLIGPLGLFRSLLGLQPICHAHETILSPYVHCRLAALASRWTFGERERKNISTRLGRARELSEIFLYHIGYAKGD